MNSVAIHDISVVQSVQLEPQTGQPEVTTYTNRSTLTAAGLSLPECAAKTAK